ncbi:MAG: hypothetical protein ACR2PX_12835 [Endozoicomonas sp.]|uniref:hypothetical protein n=1 Tax=Endozoicomonas sp. TaxID=1892382 RepID=UPI003D9BDD26
MISQPVKGPLLDPITQKTTLRKVHYFRKYIVYLTMDDEYRITTTVHFIKQCKPGSKIKTNERYSDGERKILTCANGNYFSFSTLWPTGYKSFDLYENLGGFSYSFKTDYMSFSALEQEISLLNAK